MPKWFTPAAAVCGVMFAVSPFLIANAPYESTMGLVQKIFYYHMPSAWMFLISGVVCGVASARYLFKGDPRSDRTARAAAELTVLFGLLALITGPLWARKAWGVWWTWDPRLTSTLVAGMIYFSYLILRGAGGIGESGKRFAAGLAIVGALNIPIIKFSVERWRGTHPQVITGKGGGIHPDMKPALLLSMLTIVLLGIVLVWVRVRAERSMQRLDRLEMDAVDRGLLEEA
jgi:heme exporter protein C